MDVKDKKQRGRPKATTSLLSSEAIMQQAKVLMKKDGKVPSIRLLASSLGVDAMAIYYYFKNKNALLEAITISLVSDIYQPKGNQDWFTELKQLSFSYLTLLNQYSGLLETLLSIKFEGPAEVFQQRFNSIISPLALDETQAFDGLCLLVDYLHGFALAMKCNQDRTELNIEMIEGPLRLYCKALTPS